jgi:hypothetical protein
MDDVDVENLLKEYTDNKLTIAELKTKYKVSDKIYFKIMKKYNPVKRDSLSEDDIKSFVIDYQDNLLDNEQLELKYNRSAHVLNNIAKSQGIFRDKSKKQYSEEFKNNVIEDYKSLMTLQEIYEKYSITQYMMNNIIDERGVRFDKQQQIRDVTVLELSEETKDQICRDYLNKIPGLEIVEKYDITFTALHKVLDERNVKYGQKERVEEKQVKILELYNSGMSTTKMADVVNIGQRDIAKYLEKYNVELRTTDFYNRRYTVDHDYFEKINTFEKAQILGMLAADGYTEKIKNTVNLGLKEQDKYYVEWVNKCLGSNSPVYISQYKSDLPHGKNAFSHREDHYKMTVCSPKMKKDLEQWGIIHRKTWSNHSLPPLDKEFWGAYILGYFEGDGTVGHYTNPRIMQNKYSTTETLRCDFRFEILFLEKMAYEVQKLLWEEFDIKVQVTKDSGRYSIPLVKIQNSSAQYMIKLYHFMYDNASFVMQRKHDIFLTIMNVLKDKGYDVGVLRDFKAIV